MLFLLHRRHFKRWSQSGVSDAIATARTALLGPSAAITRASPSGVPYQSIARASHPSRPDVKAPGELGYSLLEIVEELRRFVDSRDPRNGGQAVVLAGTAHLAKEKYPIYI